MARCFHLWIDDIVRARHSNIFGLTTKLTDAVPLLPLLIFPTPAARHFWQRSHIFGEWDNLLLFPTPVTHRESLG
ncbi:hypothetical protein [Microseira wollei]|uniref:hypothetical protein n=1 Tax=Microseira wollei TaxID=467598 RepID=UPI001CFEF958|nr:hypothetical protein [Microseira wollei]